MVVGAIIQARLGSERLPNKALLPLPFTGGPALLEHVVMRASAAKAIQKVIVATTTNTADDKIQDLCESKGISWFRGSTDDVLSRFVATARQYKLDVVIRLTGDNPFISPEKIDIVVAQHLASKVDYTLTEGLPLGTNLEIISAAALETAAKEATASTDKEHVTPYIRSTGNFKKQVIPFDSAIQTLRLTIDYPSDYALACLLYEKLGTMMFGFKEIEQLLNEQPWLANINQHNIQRKSFASELEELLEAEMLLQQGGFTRVLNRLKKAYI